MLIPAAAVADSYKLTPLMTRYEFTLPRSFVPTDYLPRRLLMRTDDANWLVSIKAALSRGHGLRE